MAARLRMIHPAAWVLIAVTWLLVAARTVPRAMSPGNADYGFFTAVAERLRAGDALYAGVWDNKDPFLFYSIAVARTGGEAGAWALELLWVAVACTSVAVIARSAGFGVNRAAVVGLVLSPFLMLGVPYFMGMSHLPGVALTLGAAALIRLRRPGWAGAALGVLLFFKLIMLPLAVVLVFVMLLIDHRLRALRRVAVVFAIVVAVTAVVMALRRELLPFWDTIIANARYSQAPIVSADYTGTVQRIAQHVVVLVNPHIAAIQAAVVVILVATGWRHRRIDTDRRWGQLPWLWWATAAGLMTSIATVMVTAKWLHHAEIFAVPSALALTLLVGACTFEWSSRFGVAWVLGAVATVLLAGVPSPSLWPDTVREAGGHWQEAGEVDELSRVLKGREPTSIAFVGQGNNIPRTSTLPGWSLACRHIAQRPFDPQRTFDETLACLPRAQTVVIAEDVEPDSPFPANNAFLSAVDSLVSREYDCEAVDTYRICTRQGG